MTPIFSAFQSLFSDPCRALRAATAGSLHQFEALFGSWLPPGCLAQADQGPHSRQRQWPLRLVFWTFCWQIAQAQGPLALTGVRAFVGLSQAAWRQPGTKERLELVEGAGGRRAKSTVRVGKK